MSRINLLCSLFLFSGCASKNELTISNDLPIHELNIHQLEWSSGVSCHAWDFGKLLSTTKISPSTGVTPVEAQSRWDDWLEAQALGYVTDDYAPMPSVTYDDYKLDYCSVLKNGTAVVASGLLSVPRGSSRVTTAVYHHGTAVTRTDAPSTYDSTQVFDGPSVEIIFTGRQGLMMLAPDYSGFADSTAKTHQYLVEEENLNSLALSVAALQTSKFTSKTNGKLVSVGFSEGGYNALSYAKLSQALGVPVTGTIVVGAIPEPLSWSLEELEFADPYFQLYNAYIVQGNQAAYGDVYTTSSVAYKSPFDTTVPPAFNSTLSYAEVIDVMGPDADTMFQSPFLTDWRNSVGKLAGHLDASKVDDWCPCTPVKFLVSDTDDEVDRSLQLDGYDALSCGNTQLEESSEGFLHLDFWHHRLIDMALWAKSI